MLINRADSREISKESRSIVLDMFGLSPDAFIAAGSESEVYDYSQDKVLKIYADSSRAEHLKTLQSFYNNLDTSNLCFELPKIEDIQRVNNTLVVIEKKIPGQPMAEFIQSANIHEKNNLAEIYFNVVTQVRSIKLNKHPDKFLLFDSSHISLMSKGDWNAFITSQIKAKSEELHSTFSACWPNHPDKIEKLLDFFSAQYDGKLSVVHGDIFPGNILMLDNTKVTGLIDFGMFTMFGDPIFDLAISWAVHTMYSENDTQAREALLPYALDKIPQKDHQKFWAYTMTYAILSCTSWVGRNEIITENGHFLWAMNILLNNNYWENL